MTAISIGDQVPAGEIDLFYIGGGQDREQELVAPDLEAKGVALREATAAGAVFLGVCGGYQLLGRNYRDRAGIELPGIGLLPLHTVAGERRMIGDVLLDCAWAGETLAGFENHAGRTILDSGAEPLGRVVSVTDNGAQDVLVLEDGGQERLIPFVVGPIIQSVDLEAGRIVADWAPDY